MDFVNSKYLILKLRIFWSNNGKECFYINSVFKIFFSFRKKENKFFGEIPSIGFENQETMDFVNSVILILKYSNLFSNNSKEFFLYDFCV